MQSIQELRETREEKAKEIQALHDAEDNWTPENKEASEVKFKELTTEYDGLTADIQRTEAVLQIQAHQEAPVTAGVNIQVGADREAEKPFRNLGEQLQAIYKAGPQQENNPNADKRLFAVMEAAIKAAAGTGSQESVSEEGGFLVQQDISTELLSMADDDNNDVLRSRCTQRTISSAANSLKINGLDETSRVTGSRYGGVRVYTTAELEQMTESRPIFKKIELKLDELTGLYYCSDQELQDVAFLEGEVTDLFQREFRFKFQQLIYSGSGAGEPVGIKDADCTVQVAKESGQGADTIVTKNISNMWSRMPASMRNNAIWIGNQDIEPELDTLNLAAGTAGILTYMPAGGIADAPYARLKGRPLIFIEQAETLGDAGDLMLVYMPAYIWASKGVIQAASSIHLKFDYNQTAFRWVYRADGQPRFQSALAPYKGTGTLSPFVKLAARA